MLSQWILIYKKVTSGTIWKTLRTSAPATTRFFSPRWKKEQERLKVESRIEHFLGPRFHTCAPPRWRGGRCAPCWTCCPPSSPLSRAAATCWPCLPHFNHRLDSWSQVQYQIFHSSEIQARSHQLRGDNSKNLIERVSSFSTNLHFEQYNRIHTSQLQLTNTSCILKTGRQYCGSMQSIVDSTNIICRATFMLVFEKLFLSTQFFGNVSDS